MYTLYCLRHTYIRTERVYVTVPLKKRKLEAWTRKSGTGALCQQHKISTSVAYTNSVRVDENRATATKSIMASFMDKLKKSAKGVVDAGAKTMLKVCARVV